MGVSAYHRKNTFEACEWVELSKKRGDYLEKRIF
ncbi:MAG: hypothetical protein ACRCR9_01920 [Chitinophagaceae bacterium]